MPYVKDFCKYLNKTVTAIHNKYSLKIFNVQEVFHVYLNKFEIAVSHSFLIIFGNNYLH